MSNIRICKVINPRAYDLQDPSSHICCTTVADIQLLMSAEYIVSLLPDTIAFGRTCKYINDPFLIPDLKWTNLYTIIGQKRQTNQIIILIHKLRHIIYIQEKLLIRSNLL